MYGTAVSCVYCQILTSQIFYNNKSERICANCMQLTYNSTAASLKRAFDKLYIYVQDNKRLEKELDAMKKVTFAEYAQLYGTME